MFMFCQVNIALEIQLAKPDADRSSILRASVRRDYVPLEPYNL